MFFSNILVPQIFWFALSERRKPSTNVCLLQSSCAPRLPSVLFRITKGARKNIWPKNVFEADCDPFAIRSWPMIGLGGTAIYLLVILECSDGGTRGVKIRYFMVNRANIFIEPYDKNPYKFTCISTYLRIHANDPFTWSFDKNWHLRKFFRAVDP